MENEREYLVRIYNTAVLRGLCKTQKEFALLLGVDKSGLSMAMNGSEKHLTGRLVGKVKMFATANGLDSEMPAVTEKSTLPVIPVEAMAGTLVQFFEQVKEYDCERMVSPIKGADYAIKIYGDSMSPEYPSGSVCLIKKVDEKQFIEWGKVYVLDTDNGAVIKKIRKTDRDNVVECVSINPNFQSFTIDTSFVHGWYRVLMVMSVK